MPERRRRSGLVEHDDARAAGTDGLSARLETLAQMHRVDRP
jgi:hypothetical protein